MPKIKVIRPFRHVLTGHMYPTSFDLGEHEVDDRCAEVALQEGWAVPLEDAPAETAGADGDPVETENQTEAHSGHPSPDSGPEQPSVSPPAAQASQTSTSKPRGGRK